MIKNFSSCRSVALFSCPQSLNKGWSLRWNKLPGLQYERLEANDVKAQPKARNILQHCCAHRVAHVWSPCSNMLQDVGSSLKMLQDVAHIWPVLYNILQRDPTILQDVEMLRAFGRAFKSKFLYLCVTVCVHLLPQKFSAHWHLKVILLAIVINALCELAYLLLNRIMNYY